MTTQKTSKKNTVIMASIIVALLAVIGVMAYLLLKPEKEPEPIPRVITEDNKDDVVKQLQEKVEEGMFEMTMTTTWTFENSSTPSTDSLVGNADSNREAFYFTVARKDTGEVVYTSPEIPVGSQITEVKLEKDVPAGSYPATLQYHFINESGGESGSIGVAITLNILN